MKNKDNTKNDKEIKDITEKDIDHDKLYDIKKERQMIDRLSYTENDYYRDESYKKNEV